MGIYLESLCNDFLKSYDEMDDFRRIEGYYQEEKDRLIDICHEIRMARWREKGVEKS